MNIAELVGKRILISDTKTFGKYSVQEVRILELAPSGTWVKLMNIYGKKYWKPVIEVSLVEELKDLKAGKPKCSD